MTDLVATPKTSAPSPVSTSGDVAHIELVSIIEQLRRFSDGDAFVAEKGYKLLSADYSQIELRIMAHLSGDEHMIADFNAGHDIHAATAARMSRVCAAAMRACGAISKARNSTRPSRPEALSGAYILSMQNSARWVLPVMSVRR